MHLKQRFLSALIAVALIVGVLAGGLAIHTGSHGASAAPNAIEDTNGSLKPLLTSAARTTTGVSATTCGLAKFTKYAVQLLVTAASGTTPTLDVTWQHSIDGGTTWYTVATFTQVTSTPGNQIKVESEVEAATAEVYGDCMRLSYVIAGTTPSYTFSADLFAE